MIRRISKQNDYRDIVSTCPSGDIDDIYEISYFISGHSDVVISASFEKKGKYLEVIIPSQDLISLSNGVFMRKCHYRVSDSSYPDGYYNLEFIDELNVWMGDEEVDPPEPIEYATQSWVTETLSSYATESWVDETLSSYALSVDIPSLEGYATQSWVESQGYLTSETIPSDIATQSWVTETLSSYATESWVSSQGYLKSVPSEYVTQSWLSEHEYMNMEEMVNYLHAYAYATEDWVRGQNYYIEDQYDPVVTETRLWDVIGGEGEDDPFVRENTMLWTIRASLSGYATESWVQSQGYITSTGLSGLATQSWVSSNFLSSTALSGYATESWVTSKGYATESYVQSAIGSIQIPENVVQFDPSTTLPYSQVLNWDTSTFICNYSSNIETIGLISGLGILPGGYLEAVTWSYSSATGTWEVYSAETYMTDSGVSLYLSFFRYVTESYLRSEGYITSSSLSEYATQSWVSSNFLSEVPNGYATQSWVDSQGYLTSVPSEYATQSWVSSNFLSEVPSGYATQSWVSSNFLGESDVWCGTRSQWENMTSEQQATYKIALVTA